MTASLKILVGLANFGTKNRTYAQRLIAEYRSMPHDVDVVVLCESEKCLASDVTEVVGLPTKDPWSLPFSHRNLFAERASQYDLFIYTEDDILITEKNIRAFLDASDSLPNDLLPGFLRYEQYPDGQKNYLDIHGGFHWVANSVRQIGAYVVADLSNDHSACYMLTKAQLERAINSGGFLVAPHSGRYDMLCAAATDPYTQCGFSRVMCVSHVEDFQLHHVSNAYLGRVGLNEESHRLQIEALLEVLDNKLSNKTLFATEKLMATSEWDKSFYESCRFDLVRYIPSGVHRILSVGCGSGETEGYLVEEGMHVSAIPLDAVIGRLAERKGVRVLPPNFEDAFSMLGDETFDVVVLSNVLQHVADPENVLKRLCTYLDANGVMLGSVPNLGRSRRILGRLVMNNQHWTSTGGDFSNTAIHFTSRDSISDWLTSSALRPLEVSYAKRPAGTRLGSVGRHFPGPIGATDILFVAAKQGRG